VPEHADNIQLIILSFSDKCEFTLPRGQAKVVTIIRLIQYKDVITSTRNCNDIASNSCQLGFKAK
jgi:hypothetical protein